MLCKTSYLFQRLSGHYTTIRFCFSTREPVLPVKNHLNYRGHKNNNKMKNSVYANYKKIQYSTDIQESVKFMGLKKAN